MAGHLAWQHTDWMWLFGVLMVVVWTALIAAVALLLVTPNGRDFNPPAQRARETRAEQQTRGEISTEGQRENRYLRREVRYGTFTRTLPLPEGVTEADITADYRDGVPEIHIPTPETEPLKKIAVTKS